MQFKDYCVLKPAELHRLFERSIDNAQRAYDGLLPQTRTRVMNEVKACHNCK
jgi:hypothetical protein